MQLTLRARFPSTCMFLFPASLTSTSSSYVAPLLEKAWGACAWEDIYIRRQLLESSEAHYWLRPRSSPVWQALSAHQFQLLSLCLLFPVFTSTHLLDLRCISHRLPYPRGYHLMPDPNLFVWWKCERRSDTTEEWNGTAGHGYLFRWSWSTTLYRDYYYFVDTRGWWHIDEFLFSIITICTIFWWPTRRYKYWKQLRGDF